MATQKQMAEHLFLSTKNMSAFFKKMNISSKGMSIDEARKLYIEELRIQAAGRGSSADEYNLVEERARLAHHQANCEELKEKQLRRELIKAEEVEAEWTDMVMAMRTKLLSLPGKLASKAISCQELKEIESLAQDEIFIALKELATHESDITQNTTQ